VQELYEPEEAELPVGVPNPVLEHNMEGDRWAQAEFRCELFDHDRPVAFLVEQFVRAARVLLPGLQGFHLIHTDGGGSELFEIQLSVLKGAYLVP
jgi:hypothetical protein